jgi:hypothetical protein
MDLEDRDAHDRPLERRDPVDRPAVRVRSDLGVDLGQVLVRPEREVLREGLGVDEQLVERTLGDVPLVEGYGRVTALI